MLPFIIHLDRGNNGAELWRKSFWGEDFYPIDYKSGYCEQVYPKMFMKEPMNSMSNYAFVIAGNSKTTPTPNSRYLSRTLYTASLSPSR
ncbi:hypothetical protein TL16_g03187 [Triparma laevis f. inornata]|uniref:Uncharacterized protein n=1 Tax=Triparma laevis f. inornata TaxID=1714386 RepID=A0A9W7A047_9STRA|nr:hypothetical protein TL16_g03187 [Triparma laevis f. inornata]